MKIFHWFVVGLEKLENEGNFEKKLPYELHRLVLSF